MTTLINQLPEVRGHYKEAAMLSDYTWFGVGGPAEVLFTPADADDLIHFCRKKRPPCCNFLALLRHGTVSLREQ